VPKRTIYFQQAGGGGGYGNPLLRPKEKVAQEVRNGVISLESADRDYGVSINPQTFVVNEAQTGKLRASIPDGAAR
jgi:N-methylhydantoinase B